MTIHTHSQSQDDPILGLNVGGRLFYCHRSTLTQREPHSYFAVRFLHSRVPPGGASVDADGRPVYFCDRSGDLFEYILKYLRTGLLTTCHHLWPAFHEAPTLWRELRIEADYFQLNGLLEMLYVTHCCAPNPSHRGVLHWMGRDKGKRDEYQNPFASGAIHVGGWMEWNKTDLEEQGGDASCLVKASSFKSRANFVKYRPAVKDAWMSVAESDSSCLLSCRHAGRRNPVVIDLQSILLRPTHYTLRYESCAGMEGFWNFEGSVDGESWEILHAARNGTNLRGPSKEERNQVEDLLQDCSFNETKSDFLVAYAEQHHRHTWKLDPAPERFFRYFRIIGIINSGNRCLHGTGLELYGDVHES